jgi:hypothetical protein
VTPRLTVTQEQAADIDKVSGGFRVYRGLVTLRLPERPTMPCPDTLHVHRVPIPEGTEVCIEWVELVPNDICGADEIRHPVATATLGSVQATTYQTGRTDNTPDHLVTLTNLRPIGADQ